MLFDYYYKVIFCSKSYSFRYKTVFAHNARTFEYAHADIISIRLYLFSGIARHLR